MENSRRLPPDKRKRTEMSCDKCKSRKQKCDRLLGQAQCRYCEINGIVCSTTHPRKQRIYINDEDLRSRLDLLESLVRGLIPEADLSSNDELQHLGKSLGIPLPGSQALVLERSEQSKDHGGADHAASLLPDQQGQVQYIGPSSSFAFHNKLRMLMGSYTSREFAMFGHNAADPTGRMQMQTSRDSHDYASLVRAIGNDGTLLNSLVDTYFDIVHPDFPVLHEASFREDYEIWAGSSSVKNPVWTCTLFCVLILSRRVTSRSVPETIERLWWAQVQALLPTVLFTTNIHTVQALLLAALHLHNNNHRDACWNLTGAALHVAIAMGLHRDDIKHSQTLFQRELRKQLWWTLYAFEKMQVSSYDRPSGISDTLSSAGYPNERIVGCAGHYPQEYLKHWQQLIALLGSACKAISTNPTSTQESYARPLSPVSAVIRELTRWKENLPAHLRLQANDALPLASRRPVLLLHAQCSYVTIMVSKSALLHRASSLLSPSSSGRQETDIAPSLRTVSETCIESGQTLAKIIQKLDTINRFNPFTWWDTFFAMNAALVLSLDIILSRVHGGDSVESETLLLELKGLISKYLQHPLVPGSMRAWGAIIVDLGTLSQSRGNPEANVCVDGTHLGQGFGASPMEVSLEHFNLLHTFFDISQQNIDNTEIV
ncbi:fungal-specific transcription factor domain-containing protein [Aspergillus californicus]